MFRFGKDVFPSVMVLEGDTKTGTRVDINSKDLMGRKMSKSIEFDIDCRVKRVTFTTYDIPDFKPKQVVLNGSECKKTQDKTIAYLCKGIDFSQSDIAPEQKTDTEDKTKMAK